MISEDSQQFGRPEGFVSRGTRNSLSMFVLAWLASATVHGPWAHEKQVPLRLI